MKKWGLIGLGVFTSLIWVAVIVVLITPPSTSHLAESHSLSLEPYHSEKTISEERLTAHFMNGEAVDREADTIFGKRVITRNWVEDMQEDGKLSIDTILDSLELESPSPDNS
ncbi:hypothetical protein H0266_00255 [Halobacillus locisalis]|uniref:Uncharacterized protein n=1 Tax=Halobacillus locisalis TaxID=220753 RepID=A0A838CLM5_9BACI|nr:hypothetical protein [Halobacillus locisalis]MBA2173322.1 hypothetical protein [Halobacillus locisalis]